MMAMRLRDPTPRSLCITKERAVRKMHPTGSRRTARSAAPGTSRIAPGQGLREASDWLVWRDRPGFAGAHRASAEGFASITALAIPFVVVGALIRLGGPS